MLAVMDPSTVAVIASALVAILSAWISASSSSRAADRAAQATESAAERTERASEAAAARIERAETRTRQMTQVEDRRQRLSSAVADVVAVLADLPYENGSVKTVDDGSEAAARLDRAIAGARVWAGPDLTAALDAVHGMLHRRLPVTSPYDWIDVHDRPLQIITDAAQRELRGTYPDDAGASTSP